MVSRAVSKFVKRELRASKRRGSHSRKDYYVCRELRISGENETVGRVPNRFDALFDFDLAGRDEVGASLVLPCTNLVLLDVMYSRELTEAYTCQGQYRVREGGKIGRTSISFVDE